MSLELREVNRSRCEIIERATGTKISNTISIPAGAGDLIDGMSIFLLDPENTQYEHAGLTFYKMRDVLRISAGILNVELKWTQAFALRLQNAHLAKASQ